MQRSFLVIGFFLFLAAFVLPYRAHAAMMPDPETILHYVNEARVANGLPALRENALLMQAALTKAKSLAASGVLVHTTAPAGVPWPTLARAGYIYSFAGENLAANIPDPRSVVNDWMNSPEHRANILNTTYADLGVGVAEGVYDGIDTDFVVLYEATPKPLQSPKPLQISKMISVQTPTATLGSIKNTLSLLTQYILALTAEKAEASEHL